MPLESANYIKDLNAAYPAGGDSKSQGDDHIRMIKTALKGSFPNIGGAVTLDHNQLNAAIFNLSGLKQLINGSPVICAAGPQGSNLTQQDLILGWQASGKKLNLKVADVNMGNLLFDSDYVGGNQVANVQGMQTFPGGYKRAWGYFSYFFTANAQTPITLQLPNALLSPAGFHAFPFGNAGGFVTANLSKTDTAGYWLFNCISSLGQLVNIGWEMWGYV